MPAPPVLTIQREKHPCDLNNDGKIDGADVQAAIDMTIGFKPCTAEIAGVNTCNAIVVQRVLNAAMGKECLVSTGLHVIEFTWTPISGVAYYEILRGNISGGPYKLVASKIVTTSYMDLTVESGKTYYYVVISVDSGNKRSPNSKEARVVVPFP
jgi:hypothetical protein